MACGCPVVHYRDERSGTDGSEFPAPPKSEVQNSASLLCQGSVQQLAEALQRIQSYQVRSPLITKGLEQAKELSWPAMTKKLWGIFEQVAPQIKQNSQTKLTDR
jgi:glycosyltransferase involved in cell wall biosynthesis